MSEIPHRLYLTENQMPQKWFNLRFAMAEQPDPLLHPSTLRPLDVDDLSPIFCEELARQELDGATAYVGIPEPAQSIYKIYRPPPLIRAYELEKALDAPTRIYYKFEGSNISGSHRLNSVVAQAYYAKMQGLTDITTETGAGQWDTALSEAYSYFGLTCDVFMVECSYEQRPFRKAVVNVFSVLITSSPSSMTEVGHQILRDHPDTTGGLGCAISETVGSAVQSGDAKHYVLGNILNRVFLHQPIVGLESGLAVEQLGECPDMVVGCAGGGSNLGGLIAPFMADKLRGIRNPRIVVVEPASCPSLTRGKYAYDFCDTGRVTPLVQMYTLGYGLIPSANHAGDLHCHGMSPILSKLYRDGYMEAVVHEQAHVFEAVVLFAKRETILPAPESAHTTQGAVDEALRCRESRKAKAILFGFTGTGYLDMTAYENYFSGKMSDPTPTGTNLQKGFGSLLKTPQNGGI